MEEGQEPRTAIFCWGLGRGAGGNLLSVTVMDALTLNTSADGSPAVREPALLAALNDSAFQGLASSGETRQVDPGTMLVVEGQQANDLYILLEGEVEVMAPMDGDWVRVAVLGPGSAIGEMAFLDDLPRSARVIAATTCSVLKISRESFQEFSLKEPNLALAFVLELSKIVAFRLRRLEQFNAADVAKENERKSLAAELHDQTLADLGSLAIEVGFLSHQASGISEELEQSIIAVRERLKDTNQRLRGIVQGIYPQALSSMGLVTSVNSFLSDLATKPVLIPQPLEIELVATGFGQDRLNEDFEIGLYRVIQQGVDNVIQHAQAKMLKIQLTWSTSEVILIMSDDGIGFDVANPNESPLTGHFGLASLRDRIERFLGRMEIKSQPLKGTTLRARIPVVSDAPRPEESRVSTFLLVNKDTQQ